MTENNRKNPHFTTEILTQYIHNCLPQLSVDCVVFGFHDKELKVLLSNLPQTDLWALQGGFVEQTEDIDAAATRILEDATGLTGIFLKQYYTFGQANRPVHSSATRQALQNSPIAWDEVPFLSQRFVSIGYYSLVDFQKVTPSVGVFFERSDWFDINNLPDLILDHKNMIEKALATLRQTLDYQLVGFNLMPEIFTMKDLQTLYETILGQPLKRNNFQEKILSLNILERLEKQFSGGAHKAPYLYRFKN